MKKNLFVNTPFGFWQTNKTQAWGGERIYE